ncbi:hypothetical protein CLUP02_05964 [Colletotrichum lupini]|uniref:Uncharacterized protein n=1 Tax=Colletotrichum lupini TaxID=145971 RepID=A0A9Q8WEP4_9PEZI|nr:hypothetical protein CLUP02_05964 [Colletotrichum lupini]
MPAYSILINLITTDGPPGPLVSYRALS